MEYRISTNKDAIVSDLNAIAADAFQYSQRPHGMGGGDGSFAGYAIPGVLASNDNATYSLSASPGFTQNTGPGHTHGAGLGRWNGRGRGHNSGSNPGQDPVSTTGVLRLVGVSSQGYGTVTMVINDSSKVTEISFSGKFE
ncbi:MAG TPA: hypothetical protein VL633_03035 [Bacteroidota bacterium]|nr:hypothetical protein [Bacteroidota bacterium]